MIFLKFKFLISAALITLANINLYAIGNMTCEVAATSKLEATKLKGLRDFFGDKTWEVQLAAAETLFKYSKNKNAKIQLNHNTEVMLSAIANGKLTEAQLSMLESYSPFLMNIIEVSILTSRAKVSTVQTESNVIPVQLSDALVNVSDTAAIGYDNSTSFLAKLNPLALFNRKSKNEKKYGPILEYIHADQMAEELAKYSENDRISVLEYMMKKVEIISALEVVRLLLELPISSQARAYEYLKPKMVGRLDYFPAAILQQAIAHVSPTVLLTFIAQSGNQWPLSSIIPVFRDAQDFSSADFSGTLKTVYGISEVTEYIALQNAISLQEGELLLALALANAHNPEESKQIYTDISEKIKLADDKKNFETFFISYGKKSSTPNNADFNKIKSTMKNENQIVSMMEARIKSGSLKTAEDFVQTVSPIMVGDGPSNYLTALVGDLCAKYADEFGKLQPTPEQFERVKKTIRSENQIVDIMEGQIKFGKIKTAEKFIKIMEPKYIEEHPSPYLLQQVAKLWEKYAKEFAELKPTAAEFNRAKLIIYSDSNIHPITELMKARLKYGKLNSSEDIAETFNPVVEYPSNYYIQQIDKVKADHLFKPN